MSNRTRTRTRGGVFSGGGVFFPTSLSGLRLWVDSSDTSTITQSSGLVSQWSDKSGGLNNATQSTDVNKPTTGTRTINGLNVIDFNGTSSRMDLPTSLYTIPSGNNTVFSVSAKDVSTDSSDSVVRGDSSKYYIRSTNNSVDFRNGLSLVSKTVTSDTQPHIIVGKRESANQFAYYDGGSPSTNSSATDQTLTQFRISHQDGYFDGSIAEIIIYDRALSAEEIDKVGNYLSTKWDINWSSVASFVVTTVSSLTLTTNLLETIQIIGN